MLTTRLAKDITKADIVRVGQEGQPMGVADISRIDGWTDLTLTTAAGRPFYIRLDDNKELMVEV